MSDSSAQPQATPTFRRKSDRDEKGSAMTLIAAASRATEEKTARLRAQRLEHEAAAVAALAAAVVPAAPKRVRRRAVEAVRA